MAHMFDVLARVNGYLNNLSSYFDGNINLRHLPSTPKFITACIKHAINIHPDLIDEKSLDSDDYSISLVSVIDTGDIFTPIYVCTMPGLNYPIVDKVPVYVAKNDVSGPGKAYVILVPNAIFEGELDIPDIVYQLMKIYFGLLNLDPDMKFNADTALFRLSESPKAEVPTYDITMGCVALGCICINLRAWYAIGGKPVGAEYVLNCFDDKSIPETIKKSLIKTLDNHAIKIGTLRDGMASGALISDFLGI